MEDRLRLQRRQHTATQLSSRTETPSTSLRNPLAAARRQCALQAPTPRMDRRSMVRHGPHVRDRHAAYHRQHWHRTTPSRLGADRQHLGNGHRHHAEKPRRPAPCRSAVYAPLRVKSTASIRVEPCLRDMPIFRPLRRARRTPNGRIFQNGHNRLIIRVAPSPSAERSTRQPSIPASQSSHAGPRVHREQTTSAVPIRFRQRISHNTRRIRAVRSPHSGPNPSKSRSSCIKSLTGREPPLTRSTSRG